MDEFDDAFGVYVGPATHEDVIAALRDVPVPSSLVVRIDNEGDVSYRHGWPAYHRVEDEEGRRDVFVLTNGEQALGYGWMVTNPTFVLVLSQDGGDLDADRYSGGVRLRSPFGIGLDIAVWHDVQHLTETGDVAPGFGPLIAEVDTNDGLDDED